MVKEPPPETTTLEPEAKKPPAPGTRQAPGSQGAPETARPETPGTITEGEEDPGSRPPGSPPRALLPAHRKKIWLWLLAAAAVALLAYLLISHNSSVQSKANAARAGAAANAPVPVVAAAARTGDIDIDLSGLGSVTALNTAVVKSRVDGQLLRIRFQEGQAVRAGELLAELDPRPFQVQLMQAQGQRAKDEAALQNAKVDLQRYQVLMQEDSIPRQQLDTQAATVKQFEAALQSDQAQIESARLNLAYCRIIAPIAGRVGLRQVDIGNIVHASDANGIVVVNEVQPITIIFTIPADRLPQVIQQLRAGRQLPVDAYDRDNKTRLATGMLAAVDNQIDPTTGTVRLRALFANEAEALFPSQFVNARLLVDTLHNVVLVPTAAIQRSPTAVFVYRVKPDRSVEMRNVDVLQTEGDSTAVRSGLAAGDVVVTDGVDRLRSGSKVAVTMTGPGGGAPPGGAPAARGTTPAGGRRRPGSASPAGAAGSSGRVSPTAGGRPGDAAAAPAPPGGGTPRGRPR
jgi:multidrug efflux system membrane fusion protein